MAGRFWEGIEVGLGDRIHLLLDNYEIAALSNIPA